jgi:hypothetical protein
MMSRSPLEGCYEQGFAGPARSLRVPIPHLGEKVDSDSSCRVLMRDGEWTAEATASDRRRLAGKPEPPFKEGPMLRAWAADVAQRKHRVRTSKLAHLKGEIEKLRQEGLSWPAIGKQLGVPFEAARMVVTKRKR